MVAFIQRRKILIIAILAGIVLISLIVRGNGNENTSSATDTTRSVLVRFPVDFAQAVALETSGVVESATDATVRARKTGIITRIYKNRGDKVSAGTLIAEIENEREYASLARAEAALTQAESMLAKLTGQSGVARTEIIEIRYQQAVANREQALDGIYNSLRSAYISIDDAIRNKSDIFFSNPKTTYPTLTIPVASYQTKINLEAERILIEGRLSFWENTLLMRPANDSFIPLMHTAESDLDMLVNFVNTLSQVVSELTPDSERTQSTLDGYKASMQSSRTSITSALTLVAQARNTFVNTETSFAIAEQERALGVTGAENEDVLSAEASVEQARAGVRDAQISLGYTLVRSPITGVLNDMSIRLGTFVNQNDVIVNVIGDEYPSVVTYVSEQEGAVINVGARALIDGTYQGIVSYISPALTIEGKREVRIALTESSPSLFINSTVPVTIERMVEASSQTNEVSTLPLSALKVRFNDTVVFSVSEKNTLIAHPVFVEKILGDTAQVRNIPSSVRIVTDARGLNEGDNVTVVSE